MSDSSVSKPTSDPPVSSIPHGTQNGYGNYHCRCDACKAAAAEYRATKSHYAPCPACGVATQNRYRGEDALCRSCRAAAMTIPLDELHATETGYTKGCRCAECRKAHADARRARRHRDLAKANAYDREYKRRRRAAA